ncbi:MAG: hypothetical protein DIU80_012195 [Chloroflexota bacterium]|nr:MAG: hypothetical protein DIU80_06455 [Chloroflexota bacterium]
MKRAITNPTSAAVVGAIFCLPLALLFAMLLLKIEPNLGPLQPLLTSPDPDQPDVIGSLVALGALLLVVAALGINLVAIGRTLRAGGSLTAHPASLALVVVALVAIVAVAGGIAADQYPCWIGAPNCD